MFKLQYVFNVTESEGYLFRAPKFIAQLFTKYSKGPYDYAPSEAGF